jgi:hypothetical protein
MDPKQDYDSLDRQVNQYYKPKMGFWKKLGMGLTLLATAIGCGPRYDLWAIQKPDAIPKKVSDYQDSLKVTAAEMGIYDGVAKRYDVKKLIETANDQLATKTFEDPKTKEKKTLYTNVKKYDLKKLFAARNSVDEAKKQIEREKAGLDDKDPAKKAKLDELNELYKQLSEIDVKGYKEALRQYHIIKAAEKTDKSNKLKHFLALEAFAYSLEDFDKWRELVSERESACGLLEKSLRCEEPSMWHPDEVRGAHGIRKKRDENAGWVIFWSAIGSSLIYALCNQDDDGSSGGGGGSANIGGEDGGPSGR